MVKNALAAWAPARTPLGSFQRSRRTSSWTKEGRDGKGKEQEEGRGLKLLDPPVSTRT